MNHSLAFGDGIRCRGWEASCQGQSRGGTWGRIKTGLTTYVNFFELLTAFLAQQCFASNRRVMSIPLYLDNVTPIPFN